MSLKRNLEIADLGNYKILNDIQYAYNHVLFSIQEFHLKSNTMVSHLWVTSLDNLKFRQFTTVECINSNPILSPDGEWILFLSDRTGRQQIYIIPFHGGESRCLTDLDGYFSNPAWSCDGKYIAFVFQNKEILSKNPHRIQNFIFKQDGIKCYSQEFHHIWVLEVSTGICRKLTTENFDHFSPVWSPDSKSIAFLTDREKETSPVSRKKNIWSISLDGQNMRPLTKEFAIESLAWSPDGRYIAYTGHKKIQGSAESYNHHVWILDVKSLECLDLCPELDRSCLDLLFSDCVPSRDPSNTLRWDMDSSAVYTKVSDFGRCHIYKMPLYKEKPYPVTCGDMHVYSYCLSRNRIFFLASKPSNPSEVYSLSLSSRIHAPGGERVLSHFNSPFLDTLEIKPPESFECKGEDGNKVYGFFYKPPDFSLEKKYPLLLVIHGGPYLCYGTNFFHEMYCLAGKGFVVVCPNQIGSHSYGEKHTTAIHKNWGIKDYPDIMKALDYFISQGYIDENRLGVSGGSYGGFMTNWIIAHTNRFSAAISQRGVCEWISFFGTSDIGAYLGDELEGTLWEKSKKYIEMSPLFLAHKIQTPLLLIHGEKDNRTPVAQSEQIYMALKYQDKKAEFLFFPEEDHNLWVSTAPKTRILRLEAIIDWFLKHLKK